MSMHREILLLMMVLFQISACASEPPETPPPSSELKPLTPEIVSSPTEYADAQLKSIAFSDESIQLIHSLYLSESSKDKHWIDNAMKIVSLNVFGFLSQSNYMAHDSPLAIKKIKRYLKDHRTSFHATRLKYAVSSNAIASLLWVETKHGKTIGSFPLPWVFYSLIMGAHPQFIKMMLDQLPERLEKGNPKNLTLQQAQEKVIERCKSKAVWALEELKAIHQIQEDHDFDPFYYKASFAGAFGIPQFIPSTYLTLATSDFRNKPDLFKHSDAIASVAHFLQVNGWKDNDPDSQVIALYSYNRSKDYGAVILKLAQEVLAAKNRRK